MAAEILGVVEGLDTLADRTKTASAQLEAWAQTHGLDANYRGVHGIPSRGQQELCALYRSDKLELRHDPETNQARNPFDEAFLVDTTESLIKEYLEHHRPSLELSVVVGGAEQARMIVAHTKSKVVFARVDFAHLNSFLGAIERSSTLSAIRFANGATKA